jgi:hypothetical protein
VPAPEENRVTTAARTGIGRAATPPGFAACVLLAATLLSGCAGSTAPASERGFFGGLGAMVTGEDERQARGLENAAAPKELRRIQARRDLQLARQQQAGSAAQLRGAQARLDALEARLAQQRAELARLRAERGAAGAAEGARLQSELETLERARRAAGTAQGGPSAAEVQRLERRSEELARALERYRAI